MKRILIAAPLRQDAGIFREYQNSLDRLVIPEDVTVDRYFVVNDCPEVIPEIRGRFEIFNTFDEYAKTKNDHIWTADLMHKMSALRNATIKAALDGGYDYMFSVDTDLILHPETLKLLLEADKDIVSEIFWTLAANGGWWCNAWMYDQYSGATYDWTEPGLYKVGMTGALTLIKTDVFRNGVDYTPIPNIQKALIGEDRHFCVRAACAGYEMYVDTHLPAEHLFTDELYRNYIRRLENEKNL